ncbi:Replication protein A 70 kDa DNA-binding subunit [Phytophthora cinnamomi]|uniref:Replication protein A 70 kDa DNA-binding subunit n=1 Tax=Phytophthora cinnamomi TaxID=4785 RepID=UPI0035593CF5|nr:Replication protein A 70 kDa DNA-binding subunit [Phytophthora cinnamomi]
MLRAARAGQDWLGVAANNDVNRRTAYPCIAAAQESDEWAASPRKPRGGRRNAKIDDAHVDYLITLLDENCYLTLDEMVDALEARFSLKVSRQAVKHHIDGRTYTVKQTHRDNNFKLPEPRAQQAPSARLRRQPPGLHGCSLKGKRAVGKNTASKGSNIHVIACISENGLAYSERRFGSFTSDKCNEFMRRLLRHISLTTPLNDVVIVADNAPCHANVEDVFKEEAFSEAKLLRLGPYSPMLNPIEKCFSTFKAMVKRFLARHSQAILEVPSHRTIKERREQYLLLAADLLLEEAITPGLCHRCALHTIKFHADAIQLKAMPVGQ